MSFKQLDRSSLDASQIAGNSFTLQHFKNIDKKCTRSRSPIGLTKMCSQSLLYCATLSRSKAGRLADVVRCSLM